MTDPRDDFLRRLNAVEGRLRAIIERPNGTAVTNPDPRTGERWDEGQIWAHLAEFLPYWIEQAGRVVGSWRDEPVAFGRTKSDTQRIAAIERDRLESRADLLARTLNGIAVTRVFLANLPSDAWSAVGRHETLGRMPLARIVDEFLVGHLEEHLNQLDEISGSPS